MEHENRKIAASRTGSALFLLCAAQLMIMLDTSIVHIALPSLRTDLGASARELQWVAAAYALAFGGFMLPGGRLGDLFGRRRMLIIGLALFTAASAGGGLAGGIGALIAARAVQGLGAALAAPAVLSLLSSVFPEGERRNRALGVLGAVSASGFIAGLVLGGMLTAGLGWRWVFFVNIPIGAALIILIPAILRESVRLRQPADLAGTVTVTAGLALLAYACSAIGTSGPEFFSAGMLFLLSVMLLAVFIAVESRVRHPLTPLRVFKSRSLAGALAAAAAFGAIMGPALYMLTFYMQNILGYGPLAAGFAFLPQEIAAIASSRFIGKYVSKFGTRNILAGGMVCFLAGALALSGISAEGSYWQILPGMILIGFGIACVIVAGAAAAMAETDLREKGLVSGLWNTAPQIGSAVGLALLVTVADAFAGGALRQHAGPSAGVAAAWVSGFKAAFIAAAGIAAAGLWGVLALLRK